MWIVKHLPVSTEQQREPLAAPQEVAPMAPMQESVRLPLLEQTVLAQSATAGALDRGTQVLQDSIYHLSYGMDVASKMWTCHSSMKCTEP